MRSSAALVAVALAALATAPAGAAGGAQAGQTPAAPATTTAGRAGSPGPNRHAQGSPSAPGTSPDDLARIKRRLEAGTPILDAVATAESVPMFRTSVTERVDIWKFWGEPSAVAALVRPRGGTWHNEFQNMVTPDEFKGFGGGLGNGEKLQLAATSLAFAGAMKLVGIGVQQAKDALKNHNVRKAKEEVQRELEAFYQLHPEARPAATATPP